MTVPTVTWVLPRPKRDKYPGGFPLHFEVKLWRMLGEPESVLHPFGGRGEIGHRIDLRREVLPDVIGDAHTLCVASNSYELVILDPPYNDDYSRDMYGTGPLAYKRYIGEAVRVTKPGGFVAMYHMVMTPRPLGTKYYARVVVLTRVWHKPRVCCVFQKE